MIHSSTIFHHYRLHKIKCRYQPALIFFAGIDTVFQLLNIPYDKNLDVERLPEETFNINYDAVPEKIYATALQKFAQIKAVHLRTESAQKTIRSR